MISVEKALELTDTSIQKTNSIITIPISNALDHVLANDIASPIDMPPFRQSAMDGYALGSIEEKEFEYIGEIKAGDDLDPSIRKGQAIRIFTGAPVPSGAKSVIMQEKVNATRERILLQEHAIDNANIRPIGEQIKKGQIALPKETYITASGVGYLATLGLTHVDVYKKPSIAIIATGNELIPPGQSLKHGEIYESNSIMLASALNKNKFADVSCYKVEDEYSIVHSLIESTIEQYDVVLITGGISVGDYDFVGKALTAIGVEEIFYKVKQKPGKPLFFGKKQEKTIFALPGNPGSALSCFYMYVLPALFKISGKKHTLNRITSISTSEYSKKGQRSEFLKAVVEGNEVTILDGQASSMLRSFALANALVYLPEDTTEVKIGDALQVILLP
ncbi:molybdopterin molybdotransferase MoeA [Aquimarina pacifica]|uniref:molybdopterin molybdotransferase MoeA n=1 Tax=Aquimarina pacifica TaxID=1296415 RepID=UPI00046EB3DE|nr:gephyrin-like molybdotransferase Glp [Aquimarina pacifica]